MAKINLIIASRTEQENYILQKKLEVLEYEFAGLTFSSAHPAGLVHSTDRLTGAVIINLNEWNAKEGQCLLDLRTSGYKGPVLVTAKPDVLTAFHQLKAMNDVNFLEKPFDVRNLTGIVRKMLKAHVVSQQVHRRYNTSQDAEIEFNSGNKHTSQVRNLSRGGACLEVFSATPTKIGEELKVRLELKDLKRTYTLPAKVVWSTRVAGRGIGIGVAFTGPGDVKSAIFGYK